MASNSCSCSSCNIKFFIFAIVGISVVAGIVYYVRHNPSQKKIPNGNLTEAILPPENITTPEPIKWEENEEIQIFREYLQIPTIHPNIDYKTCVEFLKKQAKSLNLSVVVHYPVNTENPVVVMTWDGSEPELPSIMLNSHMDVVPVFAEFWTHPPFAAEIDENGNIFARGTQDTKASGMQYLAAIRALMRNGTQQLNRTIHVVFVPDEEAGGYLGMSGFVQSQAFMEMNVGFVIDEGLPNEKSNEIYILYTERTTWKAELTFHGNSGHGSLLLNDTASEKLNYVVSKITQMRTMEAWKLNVLRYPYGTVTTINLTILRGGVANNVIPPEIKAVFDIRFSVDANLDAFEAQLNKWCTEAGGNITIEYPQKEPKANATSVDDTNPYWTAIKSSIEEFDDLHLNPVIMRGATDARFIRRMGIPAFGLSPQVNTPTLAHDHNEHINANVYLFGIEVFQRIITNLGTM